jgi:hypothetical protein
VRRGIRTPHSEVGIESQGRHRRKNLTLVSVSYFQNVLLPTARHSLLYARGSMPVLSILGNLQGESDDSRRCSRLGLHPNALRKVKPGI